MYETNINVVVKDHTTYRWIQLIIWACFHITKCLIGSGGFGGVPLKITCFPCFQHIFGKITTSADLRKAYINLATHMHNLVNQNMTPWLEVIAVQKKNILVFFFLWRTKFASFDYFRRVADCYCGKVMWLWLSSTFGLILIFSTLHRS